ncbi:hypothetical protein F2Q68_00043348 [Brassica cretica]|uniref:Uncharacterized protein n=1 Tax=Brassica cretica TaxID=69181 RepID=A0A8S9LL55_BRACR|nr:hypothetical protein F2Q68_00043348 [Brassica cretica]
MNSQEDEVEKWEAFDLGDSELPSFLRPCKRKSPSRPPLQPATPRLNPKAGFNSNTNHQTLLRRCSSRPGDRFLEDESHSRSLIPGPAGTVQVIIASTVKSLECSIQ